MDKLRFMRLWDLYHNLLTDTQKEICELYFNLDLTVSEIAEQKGVSRQAVSECLTGCKKQLADYEAKLGFEKAVTRADLQLSFMKTDLLGWAEGFFANYPTDIAEQSRFYGILDCDYESAISAALSSQKKG